ncbi:MAG TPA: DUF1993 domain-containing protein [Caulobacteraceae bacterium]|nr:DUF1993 domain-containing protein [Caulobacteraceae bacterium]
MSLSTYDISVPVFRQYLAALSVVLAKGEAACAAGSLAEADLIDFRLYPDMQPFWFQVRQAIVHSAGAVGVLRGQSYPRAQTLDTLGECKAAVDAAVAYMDAVKPADLSIDPGADVGLNEPKGATITARDFLLTLSFGHFFFHAATAYDILRCQGVAVGKLDFMGDVPIRAPG